MKKLFFCVIILATICSKLFAQTGQDTLFYNKANQFSQQRMQDSAIVLYTQAIDINPNFVSAIINRGFAYFDVKQVQKGLNDFDMAIQVAKHKYRIAMYIADVMFKTENYDFAYNYFKKASSFSDTASEPYFKMGRCLWLKRVKVLVTNKVEDYAQDTALKSHLKDEIMSYYNKAIYLDSVKNNQLYLTRSQTDVMQDMHSNYEYYYDRAIFEANFAEYSNALADYEMSIQIHPTISAFEYAAYIARKLGQNEKACSYIQTWATLISPSEKIDAFKKHEIADKFCEEIGQKFDKNAPLPLSPLSQNKSDK